MDALKSDLIDLMTNYKIAVADWPLARFLSGWPGIVLALVGHRRERRRRRAQRSHFNSRPISNLDSQIFVAANKEKHGRSISWADLMILLAQLRWSRWL